MPFLSILNRLTLKLPVESFFSWPSEILRPSLYYKTNQKKKKEKLYQEEIRNYWHKMEG
jgi:hypothetical protein